jgi:hypothetical protein
MSAAAPDKGFVRGLGLADSTMIVVGVMIGSGFSSSRPTGRG